MALARILPSQSDGEAVYLCLLFPVRVRPRREPHMEQMPSNNGSLPSWRPSPKWRTSCGASQTYRFDTLLRVHASHMVSISASHNTSNRRSQHSLWDISSNTLFPCFLLNFGIGFGRHFGSFWDHFLESFGGHKVAKISTKNAAKNCRNLRLIHTQQARCQEGGKGEVNLPAGVRRMGKSLKETKTGRKEE